MASHAFAALDDLISWPKLLSLGPALNVAATCERTIQWLEELAAKENFALMMADCGNCNSDRSLFKVCTTALKLPEYFGMNWDALDECIHEFDWIDSERIAVVWCGVGKMAKSSPKTSRTLREISNRPVDLGGQNYDYKEIIFLFIE